MPAESSGSGNRKPAAKKKPRSSSVAIVRRNASIVHDRMLLSLSQAKLAEKYGVTDRTIRNVLAAWREEEKEALADFDSMGDVAEMIHRFDTLIEQYAEVYVRAMAADEFSPAIGALNGMRDTIEKRAQVLQAAGLLPEEMGTLRYEFDMRFIATAVISVFKEYKVPIRAQDTIMDALRMRVGSSGASSASRN